MFGDEWRRRPLPAQLNLRVAVLGGVALVMFSIIFFRLWYLQVLSSASYVKQAQNNQVRDVSVQAPRGDITDRTGQTLVRNRTALALQVHTIDLPSNTNARTTELKRLAQVAGMKLSKIRRDIQIQEKQVPGSPVTLKRDVQYDLVYYLRENQHKFPGISVDRVYVRDYPHGTLAAHVLGYVREVSALQLKDPQFQGVKQGDQVGQSGVEFTYDSALRGINGDSKFQVDAAGRPTGRIVSRRQPQAGDNLKLTLDDKIQEAGQSALASFGGLPGAFVAMNVHNGQVLGLGSYPTYDPSFFTHPILSPAQYKALTSQKTGSPLTDRAIQGQYPTGSTFKPITSLAALASHTITPSTTIDDTGSFSEGPGVTLHNAGNAAYGPLQLASALRVSSDIFFYHLGADMNTSDTKSGPLQKWAHALGIGQPTGIDVPGELSGTLPTPPWLNRQHQQDPNVYDPWTYGANVNLATGQGYLEATPLQMATAYAALGNGGEIVRPHVGLQVSDPEGRIVQRINPAPQRHVDITPEYRNVILQGLHEAAQTSGGTSDAVFGNYPVPVAGKTGTAVRYPYATQSYLGPEVDQSWYVLLAPYPNPKVVIAVTIERGGFGVQAAAPAARQILNAYYAAHGRHIKSPGIPAPGTIATAGSNPY